jgi:hypothetical protein
MVEQSLQYCSQILCRLESLSRSHPGGVDAGAVHSTTQGDSERTLSVLRPIIARRLQYILVQRSVIIRFEELTWIPNFAQ